MPIEALLTRQLNAQDFQPPAPEGPETPRQMYESLKRSEFFNQERGMWIEIYEDNNKNIQQKKSNRVYARDQLMGVLTKALFTREGAKEDYDRLKEHALYNNEDGFWNVRASDKTIDTSHDTQLQLLELLIEGNLGEDVRPKYEALKTMRLQSVIGANKDKHKQKYRFYDANMNEWTDLSNGPQSWHYVPHRGSQPQILAIAVEATFDKEEAQKNYEKLKQSKYYDPERGIWRKERGDKWGAPKGYMLRDQLLGVLVEGIFDKKKAKEDYDKVKKTFAYEKRESYSYVDKYGTVYKDRYPYNQLLCVMIEDMLEESDFTEKQIPVPDIRIF